MFTAGSIIAGIPTLKRVYLTGIHLTLGYITAIVSGNDFILLFLNTLFAIISVILFFRYKWYNLLIYATFLTYFTHFVWFINNPFLGNRIELVSSPQSNLIFIFVYTAIFAFGNIYRGKDFPENIRVIISTFLNSIGGYSLFLLITLTKFKSDITVYHLVFSILFLTYSIFFWIREKSKYSTFFYAILGYSALSVAIISGFEKPDFFIWLCWQSVIVIITALLFRSNIIIVANFLIYLVIFFAYLIVAENISIMVLSFGIVALISARIMNWQKDRLELKTELMRNSYLTSAFFIFPYGLYHLVPEGYISISWLLIAFMYYLFSVILKNNKYRWMALFTILLTVLYIFIIGIIRLEPLYRIISFLALGLVLIITSLLYTKLKSKQNSNELKNG